MPTYEYECDNGHTFEAVQKIKDKPLSKCKECDAKVKRLICPSSFSLKGGGWAEDGYTKK